MGKRSIIKRSPLKRNQQIQKTIYSYFKNAPKRRRGRQKKRKNLRTKNNLDDDSSYILPSNSEKTDDFDNLDLEDETIYSLPNSIVIDLNEDENSDEERVKTYPKIRTKRSERKRRSRSIRKRIKKIREKKENMNSFDELNHCYSKLSDLIDEYKFEDIADVILKLNNDIKEDIYDKKEIAIFNELKKINSVIKKKEDIIMMCLSILNQRKAKDNNDTSKNSKKLYSNQVKEINEDNKIIELREEKLKEKPFLNSFREIRKFKYKYGLHYYNSKNGVYIYDPREGKKKDKITLYCKKYISSCRAKCVVYKNSDDVTMKGSHNHNGISYNYFCKINPEFKNKNWEHAQVVKENGKEIIVKQC